MTAKGMSAFLEAVQRHDIPKVQSLVKAGADINEKMPNGRPALTYAVLGEDLKMLAWLLENGASPDDCLAEHSPLFHAVQANRLATVRILLAHRALLHRKNHRGKTVIDVAISKNFMPLATFLTEAAARRREEKKQTIRRTIALQRDLRCPKLKLRRSP